MTRKLLGQIEDELLLLEDDLVKILETKSTFLKKPLNQMILLGGKQLRPAAVLASARFGNYSFKEAKSYAIIVELIHVATLIHDDIIDDASLRRGKPSLQAKLGKDVAVLAGDFVFCKLFDFLGTLNNMKLIRYISKLLNKIFEGEIKQKENLFNTEISFNEYIEIIQKKTALLFALSCELGAMSSDVPKNHIVKLYKYGFYMGTAFQIIDDLLDIIGDEKNLGKQTGEDLIKGVMTLPILYALNYSPEARELENIIKSQNMTPKRLQKAINIIKNSEALEFTRITAKTYAKDAEKSIRKLPDIPIKKILIKATEEILERTY